MAIRSGEPPVGDDAKAAGLFAGALGCADIVIGSLPLPGKEMAQEIKGCFEKGAEMASLAD